MLTLENNSLTIRFPHIHPDAICTIDFQRTLRIPDDNRAHKLPPSLGNFPLAHVDDFAAKLPAAWQKRGGVFLPMHQSEAMWIRFNSKYPFAVKIASGKINAVTGKPWTPELNGPRTFGPGYAGMLPPRRRTPGVLGGPYNDGPFGDGPFGFPVTMSDNLAHYGKIEGEQDYLSVPDQRWLDGFCVSKGKIRQFVAMPMGEGYTAEEQITGEALHGGLQIIVYPLKPEFYRPPTPLRGAVTNSVSPGFFSASASAGGVMRSMSSGISGQSMNAAYTARSLVADMGMAPGGLMEQSIHEDKYGLEKFDQSTSEKCFVHLLNSQQYQRVTGRLPLHQPPSAADYTKAGLPWYSEGGTDSKALPGGKPLQKLDSVANLDNKMGKISLPENAPLPESPAVTVVKIPNVVRNGGW